MHGLHGSGHVEDMEGKEILAQRNLQCLVVNLVVQDFFHQPPDKHYPLAKNVLPFPCLLPLMSHDVFKYVSIVSRRACFKRPPV